ncbi:MAG: restriction endonuclease [Kiritimatiellae bacterium]|nr:restriction endonuclease [Kiritimatiellia bacterium]
MKLADLKPDDYPHLLLFPRDLSKSRDLDESSVICHFDSYPPTLRTRNIMGFVGVGDTSLTIASRFARDDKRDFFLHYMLGKVLSINVVNLDTLTDSEGIEDFLPYLFPGFLQKALNQGLLRQYRTFHYNDANIRGVIDVQRHIRQNIPFAGKVAYNTREYTANNAVTQLVRHTIDHLRANVIGRAALTSRAETRGNVQIVEEHTPSYNRNDRAKIIRLNLKPVTHPYFTEWRPLQKLCLQILRYEKISFGEDKDKVHGLLLDGAWLWEEYLNTMLASNGWDHPDNRTRSGVRKLFKECNQTLYPDFIKSCKSNDDSAKWVADAKYMFLDKYKGQEDSDKTVAVYYKTITYMYRFGSKHGFLFFPFTGDADNRKDKDTLTIAGPLAGKLTKLGLSVPQSADCFSTFSTFMRKNETVFLNRLKGLTGEGDIHCDN